MKITQCFTPKNRADWRGWLEQHHDREREVWVVYFKPGSGQANLDYESSVEEALCFRWIDSVILKIDDLKYARKFNPRRPGSLWSPTNQRRVKKIIAEGRMTAAGLAKVTFDVQAVDAGPPSPKPKLPRPPLEIPAHIEQALQSTPGAWEAFQTVTPSLKRTYIMWLSTAKKPETYERRLKLMKEEVLAGKPTSMH